MKILLVNKFLFPKGGDAVVTLETGRILRDRGHTVAFWGMDHPENPPYPDSDLFVSHIDYAGHLTRWEKIKQAGRILYSLQARKRFQSMIRRFQPDIIHLHNFAHQISPSILPVANKARIPMVMTMHDYKMVCPVYTLYSGDAVCERCRGGRYFWCSLKKCAKNSLAKSFLNTVEMTLHHQVLGIYRHIRSFISPSLFLKDKITEMGFRVRTYHLPNPVDAGTFPDKPVCPVAGGRVCYFGRLSHEKGLLTLIQALRETGLPATIIGTGPLKSQLEERVRRWQLSEVRFPGYRTGPELVEEILASTVVVLPSEWYENNPRSVLEAFLLRRPVIAARIGGLPEMIEDRRTGLLFTAGNVSELGARMREAIENSERTAAMGERARKTARARYSGDAYYRGLMEIYESARRVPAQARHM